MSSAGIETTLQINPFLTTRTMDGLTSILNAGTHDSMTGVSTTEADSAEGTDGEFAELYSAEVSGTTDETETQATDTDTASEEDATRQQLPGDELAAPLTQCVPLHETGEQIAAPAKPSRYEQEDVPPPEAMVPHAIVTAAIQVQKPDTTKPPVAIAADSSDTAHQHDITQALPAAPTLSATADKPVQTERPTPQLGQSATNIPSSEVAAPQSLNSTFTPTDVGSSNANLSTTGTIDQVQSQMAAGLETTPSPVQMALVSANPPTSDKPMGDGPQIPQQVEDSDESQPTLLDEVPAEPSTDSLSLNSSDALSDGTPSGTGTSQVQATTQSVSPAALDTTADVPLAADWTTGDATMMTSESSETPHVAATTPGNAGSTSSPVTSPQPLTAQVLTALVERMATVQADPDSITIRLDPPELGELEVEFRQTDDGTRVRVDARDAVTMEMLASRGTELERLLRDNNIDFFRLDFGGQNETDGHNRSEPNGDQAAQRDDQQQSGLHGRHSAVQKAAATPRRVDQPNRIRA